MDTRGLLTSLILFLTSAPLLQSQNAARTRGPEQSSFGGEEVPGIPFLQRPVRLPRAVLQILKEEATVMGCLTSNGLPLDHPIATWFVAATVHLDGQHERDLVVLPSPRAHNPDYGCFHSASGIQSIWLFRRVGKQYNLVLTTTGNGINILPDRHSGFRDIQSGTIGSAGRIITTVIFHFDGNQYQEFDEETKETQ